MPFHLLGDAVLSVERAGDSQHVFWQVPIDDVFDWRTFPDVATSEYPRIQRLYDFLNQYSLDEEGGRERSRTLVKQLQTNEAAVSDIVAENVLKPLAGKYLVSDESKDVRLGLGKPEIWHGYLDMVVVPSGSPSYPVCVVGSSSNSESSEDEDEQASNSEDQHHSHSDITEDENCLEFKQKDLHTLIWQMIGEIICFSFTLRGMNLKAQPAAHELQTTNTMAAGLGISKNQFIFLLYDSEMDILMVSDLVPFISNEEEVSLLAIFQLWVVLHYGKYCINMKNYTKVIDEYQLTSGFPDFAKQYGVLDTYLSLTSYKQRNVDYHVQNPVKAHYDGPLTTILFL